VWSYKQKQLYRAWQLKENLRGLYQGLTAKAATRHLDKWCRAATRSTINAFTTLARRIRHHFDGIIAAISHRLSNSRIEGINGGIRLIQRRANGYASLEPHRNDPPLPRRSPHRTTKSPIET
jgi:transposase